MKTWKFGRTALVIALATTIILSVTGDTIAWFTDEVTSEKNVIQSGNLAFRYNAELGIISEDAGVNKAGEEFELSDSLLFKAANVTDVAGWEAFDTTRETFSNFNFTEKVLGGDDLTLVKNGVAFPGEDATTYVLVVLEMPTTVGNEANHNGDAPTIELGLKVVATQLPYEEDSFGSDYDATLSILITAVWMPTMTAPLPTTTTTIVCAV